MIFVIALSQSETVKKVLELGLRCHNYVSLVTTSMSFPLVVAGVFCKDLTFRSLLLLSDWKTSIIMTVIKPIPKPMSDDFTDFLSHILCSVGSPIGNSLGCWCAGLKVSYWDITKLQHFLSYVEPTHSSTSIQFTKKSETTRWLLRRWRDVCKGQKRGSLCTKCSAGTRAVTVKRRWVMWFLEVHFL